MIPSLLLRVLTRCADLQITKIIYRIFNKPNHAGIA